MTLTTWNIVSVIADEKESMPHYRVKEEEDDDDDAD